MLCIRIVAANYRVCNIAAVRVWTEIRQTGACIGRILKCVRVALSDLLVSRVLCLRWPKTVWAICFTVFFLGSKRSGLSKQKYCQRNLDRLQITKPTTNFGFMNYILYADFFIRAGLVNSFKINFISYYFTCIAASCQLVIHRYKQILFF